MKRIRQWAGLVALLLALPLFAQDSTLVEKYDSGKIKAKYTVNDGVKHGPYTILYENGKTAERGEYRQNQLHGTRTVLSSSGKNLAILTYKSGELDGSLTDFNNSGGKLASSTYKAGKLVAVRFFSGNKVVDQEVEQGNLFPRRLSDIQLQLERVNMIAPATKKGDAEDSERQAALRRLMSYRVMAGVPVEGMELDKTYNFHAKVGAELLQAHGKLSHTPPNPGWPADKYKDGYKGTSSSNIFMSTNSLSIAASIDSYMDDSDPSNIEKVGHRRWCLNPGMLKTGFGKSPNGNFSCMWAMDAGRADIPDWDYVAYPPSGFALSNYIGPRHAWNVTPNPKKYRTPAPNAVKVSVYQMTDKSPDKPGKKLEVGNYIVDIGNFGGGPSIIFRPERISLENGARYKVLIEGLKTIRGQDTKIEYWVFFVAQ